MKRVITKATNTSGMMAKPEVIEAAEGDEEYTFDDRIKDCTDNFDYVLDGLPYLAQSEQLGIIEKVEEMLDQLTQQVAETIAASGSGTEE